MLSPRLNLINSVRRSVHPFPKLQGWIAWNLASIYDPYFLWCALVLKDSNVSEMENMHYEHRWLAYVVLKFDVALSTHLWGLSSTNPSENERRKFVESWITHPRIVRFCWNLVCWCNMNPKKSNNGKTWLQFKSNMSNGAQIRNGVNRYNSAADYSIFLKHDIHMYVGAFWAS